MFKTNGLTPGQLTFMTNLDALALKYTGVNMKHIKFRGGQYYDDRNNKVIEVDEPQNDANIGQTSEASASSSASSTSSSASSTSSSNKKNLKRERQSSSKRKRILSSNKRRKIVPSTNSASKNKRVGKNNTSSRVK